MKVSAVRPAVVEGDDCTKTPRLHPGGPEEDDGEVRS